MAGGLVAGCGGNDPWSIDPDGYDGISEETFPLLTNSCSIDTSTTTMTLSVRGAETVYLTLRATDGKVIADGTTSGGAECAVPATYKVVINQDSAHPGIEKVFLDYINGTFALGSTSGSTVNQGITMTLGAGSSVVVRGSSGADKINLGSSYSGTTLQYNWINVNGDTSPDVRMTGVNDIKISTGVGADTISADGIGTTVASLDAAIAFQAYGGPDADTLTGGKGSSTLDGGDGDDKFVQTATTGADNLVGGPGVDTVDYSTRASAVHVTVCTTCDTSDVCGCLAAEQTCQGTPDSQQTQCNSDADDDRDACYDLADTHETTCQGTPDSQQTQCIDAADDAKDVCDGLCDPSDSSCLSDCVDDHTAALGICQDGRDTRCATIRLSDRDDCDDTHTSDLDSCQDGRDSRCNTAELSCASSCTRPLCSVCRADDGTGSEGDTVNDDVEIVLGGKAADTINATYAVCSDQAATPTVRCTIKGNDGDDILIGSTHADTLDGGAGADFLQGGLGNDSLTGGSGIDTVSYADRTADVQVSLNSGALWSSGQNGAAGELDTIASDIENLTGGAGDDSLRGNSGANIIKGGAGGDIIEGAGGNDSLYGEAGTDSLYGGAGNDMLVGGAAADVLVGGDGDDFIDSTDGPAAADTTIDCDGVNDSLTNTAGTAGGTADALVKDGSDTGAQRCEL